MYTTDRLKGKTVLITGASAGIGLATAHEFAKSGANLILGARRVERLDQLKEELGEKYGIKTYAMAMDVRHKQAIDDAVATIPNDFKDVDILFNNAGLVKGMDHLANVSEADFDTMMDTNVKGLTFLTQAILPIMKQRQQGHIINMGSVAGREAYPGGSIYCASKFAVEAITRSLLHELMDTPLRVSLVAPGMVETEFSEVRFRGDKDKAAAVYSGMQPLVGQDIAELVVFIASRPPHVNIVDTLVFPTAQAGARSVHRK
ncbi:NAD(P)-binding protein [Hesseltinella vesiculosa]|uniref:NAD(P)-binding protein n=1 Tax=Hesseltinella vesiculosa TaxID=101127 RepID=A0A1X2GWE7_9FUNG|nr:NAD(P)-binding protein [Hesseltinella vesiculosa]